ncbi:MAG: DNA-directed RNA polymerase subunit omega [Candidatus Margulisiibacteriota bacterium]
MSERDIDNMLLKAKNKFLLANAAAGRAKQIIEGSLPYVNNFDPNNPVITALREIAADKIRIRVLTGPIKKTQELLISDEEAKPSALERLAKEQKGTAPKKKEKKKKK